MWHMPHGIILLTTLQSNDSCSLTSELPSSRHFHATPCSPLLLHLRPLRFWQDLPLQVFIAEINFWVRLPLATPSAPHTKVPAPHPGCSTTRRKLHSHATSSDSSYRRSWSVSHNLHPFTTSSWKLP